MKGLLVVFCLLAGVCSYGQYYENEGVTSLRFGGGYTHDFPGLNGYTISSELTRSFGSMFEVGVGLKRVNLSGYPRTQTVEEYTKSTILDLNGYILPIQTELHVVRLGIGYGFSFYKIRRSFPVLESDNKNWYTKDQQKRISGFTASAEYEYLIPESRFSLGVRGSLFKAYDQVSYFGGFVGVKLN